MMPKVLVL